MSQFERHVIRGLIIQNISLIFVCIALILHMLAVK